MGNIHSSICSSEKRSLFSPCDMIVCSFHSPSRVKPKMKLPAVKSGRSKGEGRNSTWPLNDRGLLGSLTGSSSRRCTAHSNPQGQECGSLVRSTQALNSNSIVGDIGRMEKFPNRRDGRLERSPNWPFAIFYNDSVASTLTASLIHATICSKFPGCSTKNRHCEDMRKAPATISSRIEPRERSRTPPGDISRMKLAVTPTARSVLPRRAKITRLRFHKSEPTRVELSRFGGQVATRACYALRHRTARMGRTALRASKAKAT